MNVIIPYFGCVLSECVRQVAQVMVTDPPALCSTSSPLSLTRARARLRTAAKRQHEQAQHQVRTRRQVVGEESMPFVTAAVVLTPVPLFSTSGEP